MNTTGATKTAARAWIEANRDRWPGLEAAHLVGSITGMADDAPFPAHKDVDLQLIFADGSPALTSDGPFMNIVEEPYQGLLIEAGIKSWADYTSAEAVLANAEIAHHLTLESVLYDPRGSLRALQDPVRRQYRERRWVQARVEYERRGLMGALEMVPTARQISGGRGEVNILGYTFTYVSAVLAIACLRSPSTGSGLLLRIREVADEYGRPDLHEGIATVLGVKGVPVERVEEALVEGAEAFDLAAQVRRSAHPFQHKLHAHLRPYFVQSCRDLIDSGEHEAALVWITPFYTAATDVIVADGQEDVKPAFVERAQRLLDDLGMGTEAARDERFVEARRLHAAAFELADHIVATHPAITG